MDTDEEVIDLRRKYKELCNSVERILERVQVLEATSRKTGELGIINANRIVGLEQDFDKAAGRQIVANRKLQDQIDTLNKP